MIDILIALMTAVRGSGLFRRKNCSRLPSEECFKKCKAITPISKIAYMVFQIRTFALILPGRKDNRSRRPL